MPKPTKRGLIKKLDKVFSLYIRTKYSKNGLCHCYTCEKLGLIKEMQCGHFISRANYILRWEPDNARPQCVSCNMFHQGQQYVFGKKLERELGAGRVEQMQEIKSHPARFSIQDYLDMIERFESGIDNIGA